MTPLELLTPRLEMIQASDEHLNAVADVRASNPPFTGDLQADLRLEPGLRERIARELAEARADPARHALAITTRAPAPGVIGRVDLFVEYPADGHPRIGLLEIHRVHQREGYGREAVDAIARWARQRGATAIRLGVDTGNTAAMAFWQRLGYRRINPRERQQDHGQMANTVVLEATLV